MLVSSVGWAVLYIHRWDDCMQDYRMVEAVGAMGHTCQAQEGVWEAPYAQEEGTEGVAAVVAELAQQAVLGRMRKYFAGMGMCSLDIAEAS